MGITRFEAAILVTLQDDSTTTIAKLSEITGRSANACWRKVQELEERGFILKRGAVLNPDLLGAGLTVIIKIATTGQPRDLPDRIAEASDSIPEISECFRLSSSQEFFIKARVGDLAHYQRLYNRLTEFLNIAEITADFVTETIRNHHELPIAWQDYE